MGKKRRMIAKMKKFGKKFASHPAVKSRTAILEEELKVEPLVEKELVKETPKTKEVKKTSKSVSKTKKATSKKSPFWGRKKTTTKKD